MSVNFRRKLRKEGVDELGHDGGHPVGLLHDFLMRQMLARDAGRHVRDAAEACDAHAAGMGHGHLVDRGHADCIGTERSIGANLRRRLKARPG